MGALIASKGEHLPRKCGEEIHGSTERHYGDNDRHNRSTGLGARGAEKHVNEWMSCGDTKGVFNIPHVKAKGQDHEET